MKLLREFSFFPARVLAGLLFCAFTVAGASALQPRLSGGQSPGDPPAPVASRTDTLFYFAAEGAGSYGSLGTDERGYDFDGFGECSFGGWTAFGEFATIRQNSFLPADNESCLWTFFDPDTVEPGYPMGVFPYGPPYQSMSAGSPPLEVDQNGDALFLSMDSGRQLMLRFEAYEDLPLDAVVFYQVQLGVRDVDGNYHYGDLEPWLYFGQNGWGIHEWDMTERVAEIVGAPGDVYGIEVKLRVTDWCADLCGIYGDGYPHTLEVLFDNVWVYSVGNATGAPDELPAASVATLSAHPNPFNPTVKLSFELPRAGQADLSIFDLTGRRIIQLALEERGAGPHAITWDGRDAEGHALPSGSYLARLTVDGQPTAQTKLTLLK